MSKLADSSQWAAFFLKTTTHFTQANAVLCNAARKSTGIYKSRNLAARPFSRSQTSSGFFFGESCNVNSLIRRATKTRARHRETVGTKPEGQFLENFYRRTESRSPANTGTSGKGSSRLRA
jgi:hypothetical protein